MNKLTTLLSTTIFLAIVTSPPALAVTNEDIPLITISDASKVKNRYRITSLGPRGYTSFANAITDSGMVLGNAFPAKGTDKPSGTFVFQNNRFRFLANFQLASISDPIKNQVNGSGRVVGTTLVNGLETPAIYNIPANRITLLPKGDAIKNYKYYGINDFGQVFGQSDVIDRGMFHAFIYDKGQIKDLGSLGGQLEFAIPFAINNQGAVVGWSNAQVGGIPRHPFLYEKGVMKDILPPAPYRDVISSATDINKLGQIVVEADGEISGGHFFNYSFIYQQGRYTKFQVADKGETVGRPISNAAINNRGEVVGSKKDFNPDKSRAVIYRNGIVAYLNTLIPAGSGWVLLEANDINNFGQIVGTGLQNGKRRAFLLTPVNLTRPQ